MLGPPPKRGGAGGGLLHEQCVAANGRSAPLNSGYVSHKITNISVQESRTYMSKDTQTGYNFRQKDSFQTDSMRKRKHSRQTAAPGACGATHCSLPHLRDDASAMHVLRPTAALRRRTADMFRLKSRIYLSKNHEYICLRITNISV